MDWSSKTILLTGGTGSFGNKFTEVMLRRYKPKTLRIYSRDELKQWEMERRFHEDRRLRFFIGDVRDKDRLERAMDGADIVVHAAALKHVPVCEYNPFEAVKTNLLGAQAVVDAAIDHNVDKVLAISTDKAVNPVNLYGATKMCMEKLVVAANAYAGSRRTRMACARYGNVIGSRGSVVQLFKEQAPKGEITVTDLRMTRFWLTLDQGVAFVVWCLENMRGGEVFVPKIPSMKITDLAEVLAPKCRRREIGIRPGEKIHECLLTEDESRHALEFAEHFVIMPEHRFWTTPAPKGGKAPAAGYRYSSDTNTDWLTGARLRSLIKDL
ncbi:MAG: UDP-N-acetylglucosamine 4,6-dehydratase (inverting) [Elusimicrobia bacterium]|nr:UDP-N-acetylglucosamine 4,6-dehydratase (inverting) [Elusimicrobiota bacterium]